MLHLRNLALLCAGTAIQAFAQANYSFCDLNRDGAVDVVDARLMAREALGQASAANDIAGSGVVNAVDFQNEILGVLFGCPVYSLTPRYALSAVSVVNQAWTSPAIPSPGNLRFANSFVVTVNNTGTGTSISAIELASIQEIHPLIAGQTVRFRVSPPPGPIAGSDFLIDGLPVRFHSSLELLLTAPYGIPGFEIQAVVYQSEGRIWRTPLHHFAIVADSGSSLDGRAEGAGGKPAYAAAIAVRSTGLAAEYFRADRGLASWLDLDRPADKRSFVTAINQPPAPPAGVDPFGTGFTGAYAVRLRGEILVTRDGGHEFFLESPLGGRLIVDGHVLADSPPGAFTTLLESGANLSAGWHGIEVDSYQSAAQASLQLSWRQPNSFRETIGPDSFATELGPVATADTGGRFHLESFPAILTPLRWHSAASDQTLHVIWNPRGTEERPNQP